MRTYTDCQVLVSDPSLVSPFCHDELLTPVLHFISVDRGEKGLSVYTREARRSTPKGSTYSSPTRCILADISLRSDDLL